MAEPRSVTPQFAVLEQPEREDIHRLARLGFGTLINNRQEGEEPGQLPAAEARRLAAEHGLRYEHIPVDGGEIGEREVRAFDAVLQQGPGPVAAHCGTGKRSYLLWAAAQVLYHGAEVDALVADAQRVGVDAEGLPALVATLKEGRR